MRIELATYWVVMRRRVLTVKMGGIECIDFAYYTYFPRVCLPDIAQECNMLVIPIEGS